MIINKETRPILLAIDQIRTLTTLRTVLDNTSNSYPNDALMKQIDELLKKLLNQLDDTKESN